jgi:hypothetical protein
MGKLIEKGSGTVTSSSGEHAAVDYVLHIYQDEIAVSTLQAGSATIPGMKSIEGRLSPFCFGLGQSLTLEFKDGRKLKFFFKDGSGFITAQGALQ